MARRGNVGEGRASGGEGRRRGAEKRTGEWRCGGRADLSEGEGTQAWGRPREGHAPGAGEKSGERRDGREKNNGEQGREAWKEEQKDQAGDGEAARGNGEPEGRIVAGLRELQLAGPVGGASSPSLMAVK